MALVVPTSFPRTSELIAAIDVFVSSAMLTAPWILSSLTPARYIPSSLTRTAEPASPTTMESIISVIFESIMSTETHPINLPSAMIGAVHVDIIVSDVGS